MLLLLAALGLQSGEAGVMSAAEASETVRVSARHRLIAIRPDDGFDVRIGQVAARGGIMR